MLRPTPLRWSPVVTAALIASALALAARILVLRSGGFYWDDLILFGRGGTHGLWSWGLLVYDHDGHFMPLAFWTAALVTKLAPLSWPAAASSIVVLQMFAMAGVWRALRALSNSSSAESGRDQRDRTSPWVLAPFALYLFSPLMVPADAWWAAALNALPLQAAAGWIVADAVALCGTEDRGRRRLLIVRSAVVFLIALGFFEKSLAILPIVLVAVALWNHNRMAGEPNRPVRGLAAAWKGAAALWLTMVAIAVGWILVYLAVVADRPGEHQLWQTWLLVWRSLDQGIASASAGGPLRWLSGWGQTPPVAMPPVWLLVVGWLVLAAIVVWAWRTRIDTHLVMVAVAGYVIGAQVVVLWQRSSAGTVLELAQTYRYLPDSALVCALGLALLIATPRRAVAAASVPAQVGAGIAVVLVVVTSLVSTARFADAWHQQGTQKYLDTARKSLAAKSDIRMIDQAVPAIVLSPLAYPNNLASHVFSALRHRPQFSRWTDLLWFLDDSGRLVPGAVYPLRNAPETGGTCHDPEVSSAQQRALDGPLLALTWVAQIPYCADRPGTVAVGMAGAEPVVAPVQSGLHVLYVQFDGGGTRLQIAPQTPGLRLHLGTIGVGSGVGPSG